ncbi:Centrosomal protein of 120 kDa [Geodia barretti]|nr:Centrosomal protein of 120 kDa [Geodia barretti]
MKELAAYRHNELKSAQSILQRQQQELESVKIHSEEQKIIRKDLTQVKEEVSRVQKETFNDECPSKVTEAEDTANPDVARWIEERDILLETGVYTQNDFTIQQLDQKIKACLK